jgi:hypothetical protein
VTVCKIAAIVFAGAGLSCAIVSAVYWFRASREYPGDLTQSIADAPQLHLMNLQVSFGAAGKLNAKAALWTGAAAVLGAIGSVLGLF